MAERNGGRRILSCRRELLEHVVIFGERHLVRLVRSYISYTMTVVTWDSIKTLRTNDESLRDRHRRKRWLPCRVWADSTTAMNGWKLRSGHAAIQALTFEGHRSEIGVFARPFSRRPACLVIDFRRTSPTRNNNDDAQLGNGTYFLCWF